MLKLCCCRFYFRLKKMPKTRMALFSRDPIKTKLSNQKLRLIGAADCVTAENYNVMSVRRKHNGGDNSGF